MKHAIFTLTSIVVALGVTSAAWADASADAVKSFAQYITYLQQVAPQALKLGPIDAGIVYLKNESRLDFPRRCSEQVNGHRGSPDDAMAQHDFDGRDSCRRNFGR